jgi:alpha-ribazole phosphatase
MKLHLIRHGQTLANERRLYCGRTDLGLSEYGRRFLRARQGACPLGDVYVTSGLLRARETLEILYGPVAAEVCPALGEMNFGAFEMRGYETLRQDPAYQAWLADQTLPCPGGESLPGFRRRVGRALACLLGRTVGAQVVVAHGGVIVHMMETLFPGAGRNFYQWQPMFGGGFTVDVGRREFWEI